MAKLNVKTKTMENEKVSTLIPGNVFKVRNEYFMVVDGIDPDIPTWVKVVCLNDGIEDAFAPDSMVTYCPDITIGF